MTLGSEVWRTRSRHCVHVWALASAGWTYLIKAHTVSSSHTDTDTGRVDGCRLRAALTPSSRLLTSCSAKPRSQEKQQSPVKKHTVMERTGGKLYLHWRWCVEVRTNPHSWVLRAIQSSLAELRSDATLAAAAAPTAWTAACTPSRAPLMGNVVRIAQLQNGPDASKYSISHRA